MFKTLQIKTEEHLRLLLTQSKSALLNSIQNIHYPTSLRGDGAISKWCDIYQEIDELNKKLLDNITKKAGVYSLFTPKKTNGNYCILARHNQKHPDNE